MMSLFFLRKNWLGLLFFPQKMLVGLFVAQNVGTFAPRSYGKKVSY